jgi:hypothetical protein
MRFIAKIILNYNVSRENKQREKKFVPWEKVEKIALILNNKDNINKSAIDRLIDETKKYIEVFYIETNSKQPTFGDWKCFSKNDKTFLGLPKKNMLDDLKRKKYDVVINTCGEQNLFSTALCASLPGYLKCHSSDNLGYADLIIKKTEPYSLLLYLDTVIKYLKMIRG